MNEKKQKAEHLERIVTRDVPSQIPVRVTKASYDMMLRHCVMQDAGKTKNLWACRLNGAPVQARMVIRSVVSRGGIFLGTAPVAEMYCLQCHQPPTTRKLENVFDDEIQTVSM